MLLCDDCLWGLFQVSSDTDPLVFVHVPRSQPRSILQKGMPDNMVSRWKAEAFSEFAICRKF